MSFPEILETERLTLRRLTQAEVVSFREAFLAEQDRFVDSFARTLRGFQGDSDDYFRESEEGWQYGTRFRFGVWMEQELAGLVGLRTVDWKLMSAELFYLVFAHFEGQGIAFESTFRLAGEARAQGLTNLWLRVLPKNERSSALAERLGFEKAEVLPKNYESFDGVVHDTQVYRTPSNRSSVANSSREKFPSSPN